MSVVVSDASPLHYLILCDCIELLPKIFAKVVIPATVARELSQPTTPSPVSHWIEHLPNWASIETGKPFEPGRQLDPGEAEAISLALAGSYLLLIDEEIGRQIAKSLGLEILGTIGLLGKAARNGLIDVPQVITRLQETNMYLSDELISWLRSHTR
jgi:predicted nucleic acid-binding protein